MILTASAIDLHRQKSDIVIEPYNSEFLGTVSYKFHTGSEIAMVNTYELDSRAEGNLTHINIPENGMTIQPGNVYLLSTTEVMGSTVFAQQIFGLRSTGSLGLFINVSANLGHVGCITRWTLELIATKPVRIYPGQAIGQIIFWSVVGDWNPYRGEYCYMTVPLPSHLWRE
jgi:dCTP deaminase